MIPLHEILGRSNQVHRSRFPWSRCRSNHSRPRGSLRQYDQEEVGVMGKLMNGGKRRDGNVQYIINSRHRRSEGIKAEAEKAVEEKILTILTGPNARDDAR